MIIRQTLIFAVLCSASANALVCEDAPARLILDNGYVHLEFDKASGKLDILKGDFHGKGEFGENLISGIVAEPAVAGPAKSRVVKNDDREAVVEIVGSPVTWTIQLAAESRKFRLGITNQTKIKFHGRQWFLVGFYKRGVAQCVKDDGKRFACTDHLDTFYTMDKQKGSLAVVPARVPKETESVVGGDGLEQNWPASTGDDHAALYDVFPNQFSFPAHRANPSSFGDFDNLRAFYTAVYGSAAGCLGTFERPGGAYPNPAIPNRTYGDNYTFFDPDSWSSVGALSFSGDPYLEDQARQILELAESHLSDEGQIPHHFSGGKPTYVALSGASQTGPNIFWSLAAVDYVSATGNMPWMRSHYPDLKRAVEWLLKSYDPSRKLLKVKGPLWVDVFIRDGYTFDSNVFMLRVLPVVAAVAGQCGDSTTAARYAEAARQIRSGLESLWDGKDHYVTSRLTDWTTVFDKVDSENYAAIAWRATTDPARVAVIYRRLDPWAHPGGKGTWVAQAFYGPKECYGGNTGDSACGMARHWWTDMVARHVSGDRETFLNLYRSIRGDLLANTWLTERYNDKGVSYRCLGYHEYPEVLTMLMREQFYGLDVKPDSVTVKPIAPSPWNFDNGRLSAVFDQNMVTLVLPGSGTRVFRICGLHPDTRYKVSTGQTVTSDAQGSVSFTAPVAPKLMLKVAP